MSWPAVGARGPSWPQPVMRPITSFGLRASSSSGPRLRRSRTPGRNPSTSTSACSTRRRIVSRPSGCFRSTPIDRRPRWSTSAGGASGLPPTQRSARSTRTTSAPRSASTMAPKGAGPSPDSSMTRTPSEDRSSVAPAPARAAVTRRSVMTGRSARRPRPGPPASSRTRRPPARSTSAGRGPCPRARSARRRAPARRCGARPTRR